MFVIQLAESQWLTLDRHVKPRYLITRGPMVQRGTHETHIVCRIESWSHVKKDRQVFAVLPHLGVATVWCRSQIAQDEAEQARVSRSVDITRQQPGHEGT